MVKATLKARESITGKEVKNKTQDNYYKGEKTETAGK